MGRDTIGFCIKYLNWPSNAQKESIDSQSRRTWWRLSSKRYTINDLVKESGVKKFTKWRTHENFLYAQFLKKYEDEIEEDSTRIKHSMFKKMSE